MRPRMPGFDHLTSCLMLTEQDIAEAKVSRDSVRALLLQMAAVARPNQGAARLVTVIAHMASSDWIDGALRVEIGGNAETCTIDVLTELAGGFCERLWPAFNVAVPLDEVRRAIRLHPEFVAPLRVKHDRASKVVLAIAADQRFSSMPPARIEVGDAAILWGERPPSVHPPPSAPLPSIDLETPADDDPDAEPDLLDGLETRGSGS